MARKRGGAAGLWDRNKGWLKSVVPAALGAIPGVGVPLAIGAGAAMRGLDRPGKRGIGLDVGQAVRGGLEGYGMGKLGQGARAGIGKMLAPKAATGITPGLSNAEVARQLNPMLSGAPRAATSTTGGGSLAQMVAPSAAAAPPAAAAQAGGGNLLTKTLDFATKYEKPLGMLVEGVAGGVPSAEVETARARNVLDERRFEEELRQQRLREQRQAMMAQLLIPFLQQQMGQATPRTLDEYIRGMPSPGTR